MSQLNDPTDEILELDKHLVHSFADLHALKAQDARTVITQAEGAYVFDARGEQYLDGMAGLWCVNIGHGRRENQCGGGRSAEHAGLFLDVL